MTVLRKSLTIVSLLAMAAATASAAEVQGTLIDKMCSNRAVKDQKFAAAHDTKCALMPACERSGYGVLTNDGHFLAFDSAGNAKALAALKATKKTDDLKVTVDGTVNGDMIQVASLNLQ